MRHPSEYVECLYQEKHVWTLPPLLAPNPQGLQGNASSGVTLPWADSGGQSRILLLASLGQKGAGEMHRIPAAGQSKKSNDRTNSIQFRREPLPSARLIAGLQPAARRPAASAWRASFWAPNNIKEVGLD